MGDILIHVHVCVLSCVINIFECGSTFGCILYSIYLIRGHNAIEEIVVTAEIDKRILTAEMVAAYKFLLQKWWPHKNLTIESRNDGQVWIIKL